MKRKINIFLPILLLALLLCACNPAVSPESSIPSSSVQSVTGTSAPTSQPTTSTPAASQPNTQPPATSQPDTEPPESSVPATSQPDTQPPATTVPETQPVTTTPPVVVHSCSNEDPYINVNKTAFYQNYTTACCLTNSKFRTQHGLLSGSKEVPGQFAQDAANRPIENGKYIRNTSAYYLDGGSTYVVTDADGKEIMRIYKGGAYITLEEVAAYMYAFGGGPNDIPANYTTSKNTRPSESIWGEYLRVNHSKFSGSTTKYPYEPKLPDISGCGGSLTYYELDIGTTGTVTPGDYPVKIYNNGTTITRGAARIVHTRQDKNFNGIFEPDEVYVFYTDNHYNDFREYLNYYGGWGQIFGNMTGGGEYSSKTNCNPTPYPTTAYRDVTVLNQAA